MRLPLQLLRRPSCGGGGGARRPHRHQRPARLRLNHPSRAAGAVHFQPKLLIPTTSYFSLPPSCAAPSPSPSSSPSLIPSKSPLPRALGLCFLKYHPHAAPAASSPTPTILPTAIPALAARPSGCGIVTGVGAGRAGGTRLPGRPWRRADTSWRPRRRGWSPGARCWPGA